MRHTTVRSQPLTDSPHSQKWKIWILSYLPSDIGSGVERFVEILAKGFTAKGWSTEVISIDSLTKNQRRLTRIRPAVAWLIGRDVNRRAGPSDVIICNGYFSWNARRARSLVVYHGTEKGRAINTARQIGLLKSVIVGTLNARLEARVGRRRRIVAVSSATGREVEEYYKHRVDAVIMNAVDLEIFKPASDKKPLRRKFGLPNGKFLVLYVGPNDPRKGIGFTMKELLPRMRDSQHLVLRTNLTSRDNRCTVIGRLSTEDLADLYRACDVLLLPSYYEGCSFTIVEALSCGLPPIASATGSATDLATNPLLKNCVIGEMEAGRYVSIINQLEDHPSQLNDLSRASRAFAEENHDVRKMLESYSSLITGFRLASGA